MPKYPKNWKGKKPLHPRRGLDRRWFPLPCEPSPLDDIEEKFSADKTLDMMGGLVIREPSPCPCAPEQHPKSPVGNTPKRELLLCGQLAMTPNGNHNNPDHTQAPPMCPF